MFRKSLAGIAVAASMALAAPAHAAGLVVGFNPNGTGTTGAVNIDVLDPTVGNSIAVGGYGGSAVGTDVVALFQANLGIATLGGVTQFTNGTSGDYFTIVAGFHETVAANTGGSFPSLSLLLNPTLPSFFYMYKVTTTADNLTGTGFTSATEVLDGTFLNGFSNFAVNPLAGVSALDQFGTNNYPNTDTLGGTGGFNSTVVITSKNAGYFPDLQLGSTLALITSQLNLAYTQVDPSACFASTALPKAILGVPNPAVDCLQPGVSSVGAINISSGPNTMFQTDANASFEAAPPIPEPGTLTLLGVGLLAAARRRWTRKN